MVDLSVFLVTRLPKLPLFFMIVAFPHDISSGELGYDAGYAQEADHSGNIEATGQDRRFGFDTFEPSHEKPIHL